MTLSQLLYLLPFTISAMVSLGISAYAARHQHVSGARLYSRVALGQAATTIAYMFELIADDPGAKVFWDDVQWLTLFFFGSFLIVFSLHFVEQRAAYPVRLWGALMLVPTVFMGLVITDKYHGLVRPELSVTLDDPFSILKYEFSPLVMAASTYILMLAVVPLGLLAWKLRHVQRPYRPQLLTIMLGIAVPLAGGVLTLSGITLTKQRDVTPITFAISNLIVAWGLFRYQLFEIAPIARAVVFENMTDAVIVIDLHNRIVDLNRAAEEIIKRLRQNSDVVGLPFRTVFHQWLSLIEQYEDRFEAFETEIAVNVNERQQTFIVSVSPIRIHGDQLGGRAILLKDITERKRMEEELALRTQELAIAKEDAEASRDKALEVDRIKSLFLASMSHELRTPLNSVLTFTELVQMGVFGDVNEEQYEHLGKVIFSGRHLLSLVNDVLDITKIQSGMLQLYIEDDFDTKAELERIAESARKLLQDKSVELIVDIDPHLPHLTCDKRRVRQIMLNLVSNAVKFIEKGVITFSVKLRETEILFAVIDTGPGIAPEQQDIIFEPFIQTEIGIRHAGGTGLGLPICKSLVEAHHGKLWLESTPGEGSAFFVTLPVQSIYGLGQVDVSSTKAPRQAQHVDKPLELEE